MPADMPIWIGEISQESTPRRRATGNQWLLREGEFIFFNDDPPDKIPASKWSALNLYTYR